MDFYLFKSGGARQFAEAFEQAVKSCREGSVDWSDSDQYSEGRPGYADALTSTKDGVSLVGVSTACADVMKEVARLLGSPRVVVLFQEKSFWELLVDVDGKDVMRFSTSPEQWGEYSPDEYYGTSEDLARVWGVPAERIERYLVNWELGETWIEDLKMMSPCYLKEGKAYPEDVWNYGNLDQGYDFIRALGGDPDSFKRFWVCFPPKPGSWEARQQRQDQKPWWRKWF